MRKSIAAAMRNAWAKRPGGNTLADKLLISRSAERSDVMSRWSAGEFRSSATRLPRSNSAVTDANWLIEALAISREAIRRGLGVVPYDVQILAGLTMIRGGIAEMQTGEGKTIAGTIPAMVLAMSGRQVHVATTNAYLAARDQQTLAPAFETIGLTCGLSEATQSIDAKKAAYGCDITFATGYQFGFDYLRDQVSIANRPIRRLGRGLRDQLSGDASEPLRVQRQHHVAIVDEIDSVLIDEAMTPLVLSAASPFDNNDAIEVVRWANEFVDELHVDDDFVIDPNTESVRLLPEGARRAAEWLGDRMSVQACWRLDRPWAGYVTAALRAKHLLVRNKDYVVCDGEVQIVDGPTGRIVPDRQWNEGLHQAVQAKEGVAINHERVTISRIARQSYFRRYVHLSGMTGTAGNQPKRWKADYGMGVETIPTRLPCLRIEHATMYFASDVFRMEAIGRDVLGRSRSGQPVLVGTRSIDQSQRVSAALTTVGVGHRLLNGLQDQRESELVASAGVRGAVTVATNMAGRGTDITSDADALLAGGLHVIAVERNLTRRVDRQLLGRAGRQGQPGSGQFMIAPDDELIRRYTPGLAKKMRNLKNAASNRAWDQTIEDLQCAVELDQAEVRESILNNEIHLNGLRQHVA
ncbi:preprotein translocase subunit SecA [Rubripirellula tenax]|uniref:Protein translocase subunit SecA n=1 Tax=Rubripirellula tenax TaxID=2528015 RepID=A0A5C6FDV1_9BACT|nr:RNA helicase SecA [Rubripirellula tenax]TWU59986.1 preprotein translocase subunit SecA [Rubripirellula tenax]